MRLVLVSLCSAFLLTAAVLSSAGAIAAPAPETQAVSSMSAAGKPDAYTVTEDTVLTVPAPGVLMNDEKPEDGELRVVARTGKTEKNGDFELSEDGSFTYTPLHNFSGSDFFTYTLVLSTTSQPTSTGEVTVLLTPTTVSLNVLPVNDAPVAYSITRNTSQDTPRTITLQATDVDDDLQDLTFTIQTHPTFGTLGALDQNRITYTPNCGFTGTDSFKFFASDGMSESNKATVTINVEPHNDPPVFKVGGSPATTITTTTTEDVDIKLPEVKAEDQNCAQTLTYSFAEGPNLGVLSGILPGALTYSPSKDKNGVDHFHINVTDGITTTSLPVTINITPVNDPPTSVHFSGRLQLPENQPPDTLVGFFSTKDPDDPDSSDTYTYTLDTGQSYFTIRGDALYTDISFDYESAGPDGTSPPKYPFIVRSKDPAGDPVTATFTVEITNVNEPPEGLDDVYGFDFGMELAVTELKDGLLKNDWDIDTPHEKLTAVLVKDSGPQHGTLDWNPDGTFTYTASSIDFTGVVSFTYRVYDGEHYSQPIPVEIAVHQNLPVWTLPAETGQIYIPTDNMVTLHVEFLVSSDQITKVRYSRWDAKYNQHREIVETKENPFTYELDTRYLNPGWNQIFAYGFNEEGLPTARSWIWIKMPDRRFYLPFITSGPP